MVRGRNGNDRCEPSSISITRPNIEKRVRKAAAALYCCRRAIGMWCDLGQCLKGLKGDILALRIRRQTKNVL